MPATLESPPKVSSKVRLNLEMPASLKQEIDELVEQTGAASLSEVLRRSLALFGLAMKCQAEGVKLQLAHKDGTVETLRVL